MAFTVDPMADLTGQPKTNNQGGQFGFSTKVDEKDANGNPTQRNMTITEFGAAWDRNNPAPQRKEMESPKLNTKYDMDSILKQYEPQQDYEEEKRRLNARRNIAAISDGISAIANIVGASKGGASIYDPSKSMTAHLKTRYDKLTEDQKADRKAYMNMLMRAAQMEQTDNEKKLALHQAKEKSAEDQYLREMAQHNTARNSAINAYDKQIDDERQETAAKAAQEYREGQLKLSQDRLNEAKRHNGTMERQGAQRVAIAQQRADASGGGGTGNTNPAIFSGSAGKVSRAKNPSKTEYENIVSEMQNAGVFGDEDVMRSIKRGRTTIGAAISRGMNSAKGVAIMKKHGFK